MQTVNLIPKNEAWAREDRTIDNYYKAKAEIEELIRNLQRIIDGDYAQGFLVTLHNVSNAEGYKGEQTYVFNWEKYLPSRFTLHMVLEPTEDWMNYDGGNFQGRRYKFPTQEQLLAANNN
jgi:hypothetical protein